MDKNLLLGSIPITEQVETLLRISKEHNPTSRFDPYHQTRENLIRNSLRAKVLQKYVIYQVGNTPYTLVIHACPETLKHAQEG